MKWNNVKPDISARHLDEFASKAPAVDVVKLISQTTDFPLVVFPDAIREKIMTHLKSRKVELGGLLVGSVVSLCDLSEGLVAVIIRDCVESREFDSTSASLSMSPEVWHTANRMSDAASFVVGWYHSHPNLGAFFSGVDRKTQRDFFNSSYNLGLVIDPIRSEEKWFISGESLELKPNYIRSHLYGMEMV